MIDHPENSAEYKGLQVNAGVENLPSVNPYATFRRKKTVLTPEEYFDGIRRGDMTILSQAVTLVESNLAADQQIAQKVIELCLPYAGNAIRVGITGVPGAGKSTFMEPANRLSSRRWEASFASTGRNLPYWLSIPAANAAKVRY